MTSNELKAESLEDFIERADLLRQEGETVDEFDNRCVALKAQALSDMLYIEKLRERIREHHDGTLIVTLVQPVEMEGGTMRSTLSLRRIRVRDVRAAAKNGGNSEAFADELVEPKGAFDLLTADVDCAAVIVAVGDQLGKYQQAGRDS
ncbi:MAG: hypothetical protein AAF411_18430 [Myxococcota bacterium]